MAYGWIAGKAIHAPYRDLEFGTSLVVGTGEGKIELRQATGYCSFILLLAELADLATAPDRRCAPAEVRPPSPR